LVLPTRSHQGTEDRDSVENILDPLPLPQDLSLFDGNLNSEALEIGGESSLTLDEAIREVDPDPLPKCFAWDFAVRHPETLDPDVASCAISTYKSKWDTRPTFPLSMDHKITLIQYNVYRAFKQNKALIREWIPNCTAQSVVPAIPTDQVPLSLQPTYLQQVTPHPVWITSFPCAKVRDNIVQRQFEVDWEDLMNDLFGLLYPDQIDDVDGKFLKYQEGDFNDPSDIAADGKGIIVWGQPWDLDSWEITPYFLRRWGWMVKGCPEIIQASNKWRALRDERPLEEIP
jgi:hypothetical protein